MMRTARLCALAALASACTNAEQTNVSAPVAEAGPSEAKAGEPQPAPLAGNIFKVLVQPGQLVQEGDLVVILEAMKMETEIRAFKAGTVSTVEVKVGDAVAVGHPLLSIA